MLAVAASTWLEVVALACLSVLTAAAGALLAVRLGRHPAAVAAGLGFSTALMVLIALVDLVPEALRQGSLVGVTGGFFAGVLLVLAANVVVPHRHVAEQGGAVLAPQEVRAATLVVVGLVLHDVPEGMGLANAYLASTSLGVFVAVAIALHNLPEQFAIATAAASTGRRRFLVAAAAAAALAEPFGTALGLAFVEVSASALPFLLAFAAGAMVVVAIDELLPYAYRLGHLGAFAAGVVVAAPAYLVTGALVNA